MPSMTTLCGELLELRDDDSRLQERSESRVKDTDSNSIASELNTSLKYIFLFLNHSSVHLILRITPDPSSYDSTTSKFGHFPLK